MQGLYGAITEPFGCRAPFAGMDISGHTGRKLDTALGAVSGFVVFSVHLG